MMNLQQKQLIKGLRITGVSLAVVILVIVARGWQAYWKTEVALKETINLVFVQSVKDAVRLKAVNKPDVRGVTISVPAKTSSNNRVFRQRLRERIPAVRSYVLVDYGGDSSVSGDTLSCSIRHRTPVLHQEVFNEISYRGLVCYSPSVVFKEMTKGVLYVLLFIVLLLLALFAYLLAKRYRIRRNTIVRHRNGTWNIGYTFFNPVSGKLRREEKTVSLPAQQLKIFQWLLEDENHRIEKIVLQETFWAGSLVL